MATRKMFTDYCVKHNISEREGMLGALDMQIASADPGPARRVFHTVLEVRSFRPEVLSAIFDIGPEGIPTLMERAKKVERAHAIWTKARG